MAGAPKSRDRFWIILTIVIAAWFLFSLAPSMDLIGLIVGAFFVALLLLPLAQGKFRERRLEQVAKELGFSFRAKPSNGFKRYLYLPPLRFNAGLSNFMNGSVRTGNAVVLDCQLGSGRTARRVTVACLQLCGKRLPAFEMRPEKLADKLGSMFGWKDIDFSENRAFSRSYLLRGSEEGLVRELFHPGRLAFFEQYEGWIVAGRGEWLAIHKQRKTLTFGQSNLVRPSKMRSFIDDVTRVAAAFQ